MAKKKKRSDTHQRCHESHASSNPVTSVGDLLERLRAERETESAPRAIVHLQQDLVKQCCLAGSPPPDVVAVTTTSLLSIANAWVKEHIIERECQVLGFDVEWRPCRKQGERPAVAVVQLAAEEVKTLIIPSDVCSPEVTNPKHLSFLLY